MWRFVKRRDGSCALAPALLCGLAVLAGPRPASGQSRSGLDLKWKAPAGCPTGEVVRARVRSLVGASVDDASRLRAEGEIAHNKRHYRLTLSVRDGDANTQRVIDSESCSDLAGAAAVTLGLLMRR